MTSVGIVAIAKNEGKYLREWIAYHLSLGISAIIIYDNESQDDTQSIIQTCKSQKVVCVEWPSVDRFSPQRSAYADGLNRLIAYSWVFFIDIDEFIVPFGYNQLTNYFERVPSHVSAIAINWKTFGNSGVEAPNYELVTETFVRCGRDAWSHNCHFKTAARPRAVGEMRIHHPILVEGALADSSFQPFEMALEGRTARVVYDGIQLNHYQVKTLPEFRERMKRGNANFPPNHPQHNREAAISRYDVLNSNEMEDRRIQMFIPGMKNLMESLWHA